MKAEEIVKPVSDQFIVSLWERSGGKAWEPPWLDNPSILDLIERGYLKRCAMRFGFGTFDTGVRWTDAGAEAVRSLLQSMKEVG